MSAFYFNICDCDEKINKHQYGYRANSRSFGQDGYGTLKNGVKIYRYYFKAEDVKFVP